MKVTRREFLKGMGSLAGAAAAFGTAPVLAPWINGEPVPADVFEAKFLVQLPGG